MNESKPLIRSAYQKGERPKGLSFSLPSKTHQSFEKEANINNLVSRYIRTGTFYDQEGSRMPQFGDFTNTPDFQGLQDRILNANTLFGELPSDIRLAHGNDPARFLAWLADPDNHAEAVELGILDAPENPSTHQGPEATPESPENPSTQQGPEATPESPENPSIQQGP